MPVGARAREPSEVETPESPRRRATSKIADAYLRVNPVHKSSAAAMYSNRGNFFGVIAKFKAEEYIPKRVCQHSTAQVIVAGKLRRVLHVNFEC